MVKDPHFNVLEDLIQPVFNVGIAFGTWYIPV